jgi:hypothetical protein
MLKEIEAEAVLENCRALIDQIICQKSDLAASDFAVISPLLRHALGRRVGRQGDPGVA